jgi:hypothetical protein
MALIGLCAVAIMFGLSTGSVLAQDDKASYEEWKKKQVEKKLPPHKRSAPDTPTGAAHGSLAEAATNPLANLVQFQLQNQYNAQVYNGDGPSNTFAIQPIVPFALPFEKVPLLITRTTVPYVSTTDLDGVGRQYGFGDTTILAVFNGKFPKGNEGGLGFSLVLPTAGSNEFTGSGKYQLGPSFAYINTMVPKTQLGVFGWYHWDIANGPNGSDKPYISELSFQPLAVHHFAKGWYAGLQDVPWKYDHRTSIWTLPTGPRVGKVLKLGKLPLNLFGAVYYDPASPDTVSAPKWSFKFNITFLFPE